MFRRELRALRLVAKILSSSVVQENQREAAVSSGENDLAKSSCVRWSVYGLDSDQGPRSNRGHIPLLLRMTAA